jgi:hypothetical protein
MHEKRLPATERLRKVRLIERIIDAICVKTVC